MAPTNRCAVKVATRNIAVYRDPAVILIDQLKQIYMEGELDPVETANWFPKIARKDYQIGLNLTGSAVDDPDQQFYENYACGSERNYTGYCNRELRQADRSAIAPRPISKNANRWLGDRPASCRKTWRARSSIYTHAGTCWQPQLKGLTTDGQQRLQRLAVRGCLARQVILDSSSFTQTRSTVTTKAC